MFAKPWLKSLVVVSLMITKEVAMLCYAFDTTIPVLTHSAQVSLSYPVGRFIGSNYTTNFITPQARELANFAESVAEMGTVVNMRTDGYLQMSSL